MEVEVSWGFQMILKRFTDYSVYVEINISQIKWGEKSHCSHNDTKFSFAKSEVPTGLWLPSSRSEKENIVTVAPQKQPHPGSGSDFIVPPCSSEAPSVLCTGNWAPAPWSKLPCPNFSLFPVSSQPRTAAAPYPFCVTWGISLCSFSPPMSF